jgi:hypothetical protein
MRYLATKKGLVSMLATSNYNISDCYNQIITIDRLKEVTGENPLTFEDRIGEARGAVKLLEGVQLRLI